MIGHLPHQHGLVGRRRREVPHLEGVGCVWSGGGGENEVGGREGKGRRGKGRGVEGRGGEGRGVEGRGGREGGRDGREKETESVSMCNRNTRQT